MCFVLFVGGRFWIDPPIQNLQATASAADLSELDAQMIGGVDALMTKTMTMRSQFC